MSSYVRNCRMTRQGSSGAGASIAADPVFAQIQAETASVWSGERSHPDFVTDMIRLLRLTHASVQVDPPNAPQYEVKYYFDHTHPCLYNEICVCVTTLSIGDSGVNPVEMSIETVTAYAAP